MEKVKNLPVMRFVAFAVALALILGICSVFLRVTASAETVTNINALDLSAHQIGALGKYPVIALPTTSLLSDYLSTSSPESNDDIIDYFVPFTVYNGVVYYHDELASIAYHCSYWDGMPKILVILGGQINSLIVDSTKQGGEHPYDYKRYSYSSSGNVVTQNNTYYINDHYKATYEFRSSNGDILSDNNVSNIMYARVTTQRYGVSVSDASSYIHNSDTFSDMDSLNLPKAEFITCASFTRDDGSLPLWFKDFTADGLQYPMFSYYISDNGNQHRYQVRLSYSSSQADVVNTIFGIVNENNLSEQEKTLRELGQFLKGNLPIGNSNYTKFMALKPYMELILKKPEYISFDEAFTLNSNQMNFDSSETSGNKVYTICLSDYSDIIANYIYRAQIVDMQTSQILDTTYFCSNKTYHKGDSGTGAKIYDYGDNYSGMIDDIKNNTPSVTPGIDNKFSTTGDIINMQDNDYLSGLKIDNIFSVLGQSAKSIGAFFQACFNIVPSAILSILLSTLSLLIVLRVLGR